MQPLSPSDLARACRIFIDVAYADAATIPANKRPYASMPEDAALESYLPPSACAAGVCQDLSKRGSGLSAYEFRLGSTAYPHLKLRVQQVDLHGQLVWVFSVDTHDSFHQATQFLNADEAEAWRNLVDSNRQLKHRIEEALADAGLLTPVRLLRIDLSEAAARPK